MKSSSRPFTWLFSCCNWNPTQILVKITSDSCTSTWTSSISIKHQLYSGTIKRYTHLRNISTCSMKSTSTIFESPLKNFSHSSRKSFNCFVTTRTYSFPQTTLIASQFKRRLHSSNRTLSLFHKVQHQSYSQNTHNSKPSQSLFHS